MNEDRATRYQRLKRRAQLLSVAWTAVLLVFLLWSGWSIALRGAAESWSALAVPPPWQADLAIAFAAIGLILFTELGGLPIAFYSGFLLERRYGLSNERVGGWVLDEVKSLALVLLFGVPSASIVYACIRLTPDWWWLPAGAIFALLLVGLTNLAPVLLLPMFWQVKPLDRESLRLRLTALAERAGARVFGAYEWGVGQKTKKANAALAGLGASRRILISDTMLREYSDDEIEIVLAHELAHHVHGDIWKGLVSESALVLAGFYVATRVLDGSVGPFGLRGPADVAGLPLLLLATGAVSIAMLPAVQALSRAGERNADRFALELTKNPSAFISAMRRLGAQNLAEERPSKFIQWLFHSHPPISERIAEARTFRT